ncbi:hypothetical protein MTR67_025231 [Solanum verrucosum]|uniref:Protein TRANSPORT INHIBITOR RESPONSE 1 n=1 Tax=Solanum verrucosum TaxID=315347 RepID=A0AAF0QYG8_SOLVR|nr:hypothetical protein MTR67_025231 [Solanum verrucosum]
MHSKNQAGASVLRRLRKELQELRVFPSDPFAPGPNVSLTEQGLVAVSVGCYRVFEYIGVHAKKLEMLSLAFAGDSNLSLHYVLSGCESLRKLETRDCPFGDEALLANAAKLETMRSLWMSNCSVSFEACKLLAQNLPETASLPPRGSGKLLAQKLPGLNVEVIDERGRPDTRPESCPVENLYIYRTVSGRRFDTPGFVWIIDEDAALTPYSNGNCSLASS